MGNSALDREWGMCTCTKALREAWGRQVAIPMWPLESQLLFLFCQCSSVRYDCLLSLLRAVSITLCLSDKPCAWSEAVFHSFTYSFVLSIIKGVSCAGGFPLCLESTPPPTGGMSTISCVGCRQAGTIEGLAHCQG